MKSHQKQKIKGSQKIKVNNLQEKALEQLLDSHQSIKKKGHYSNQQWNQINDILFDLTEEHKITTVINCWRILKIVNFGDDFVPTGLIYATFIILLNMQLTVTQTVSLLNQIFFKFIYTQGKILTAKQKQQLVFFKVIRGIVVGYRNIFADNLDVNPIQTSNQMSPNQTLSKLKMVSLYKNNLLKVQSLDKQLKQCKFQPEINKYSKQFGQSRYKDIFIKNIPIQIQQNQLYQPYGAIDQSEQFSQESRVSYKFKANPVPIYPDVKVSDYEQHVERLSRSRYINQINRIEPLIKYPPTIKQFSINQRQNQRSFYRLQNCKILFMIKVEVGKRLYRVKVRQNMNVERTVQAIQKMVGFKDSMIQDVVKGYFINFQRRQKIKVQHNQMTYSNKSL